MQKWICTVCRHIYDPDEGDPVNDVPPGTSFEELLQEWHCPVCEAGRTLFEPYPDPDQRLEEGPKGANGSG